MSCLFNYFRHRVRRWLRRFRRKSPATTLTGLYGLDINDAPEPKIDRVNRETAARMQ